MRSIIKVLTCVLLALVVFVPVRTSWAHEYTPAEKKMIDADTETALKKAIKEFKDTFTTDKQQAAR